MTEINSLGSFQRAFARCLASLEAKILADGFEYTIGEGYRTAEQAAINSLSLFDRAKVAALIESKYPVLAEAIRVSVSQGIKNSVHTKRLAQDINLFKDGEFLVKPEDYVPFGEWWKKQHPSARYGGDFGDFDHFSFEWNGVK